MRFSTAAVIAVSATASLVAAQTTASGSTSTACPAQNIVDSCVAGYKSRIDTCNQTPNNWICLCDVYNDVLVCYNNCPNSQDKPPVQNQVTQYCAAAAPLRASASASAASVASVAATQSKPASASASATATGSNPAAASAFKTNGATAYGAPAGAALVGFLAAAGFL